jgi:hypothetical protein
MSDPTKTETPTEKKPNSPVDVVVGLPLLAKLFGTMPESEANRTIRGRAEDPVFLAIIARIRHWREETLLDLVAEPGTGPGQVTAEARAYIAGQAAALHTMEQGLIACALGTDQPAKDPEAR